MLGPNQDLYAYEPLEGDPKARPIRLCRLSPALSSDEMIKCELFNTSLDANEDFEALSYTWGDPKDTWPIILHGEPFYVTRNLAVALVNLRHTDRERVLWVDALCINQLNVMEKNQQIPQIRYIYSPGGARRVVIWLGEIQNARRAISFCQRMNVCRLMVSDWTINRQKVKEARARYAGKSMREQPYDDKAAHLAANKLWEYMEAKGHTQDTLGYFRGQAQTHSYGRQVARDTLTKIRDHKASEFSTSHLLDQFHVRETAYQAARLLWNRMQDPNSHQDRDPLQQQQAVQRAAPSAGGNQSRGLLLRDTISGPNVPAVVREAAARFPDLRVDQIMETIGISGKKNNPGKNVWAQVQKGKDGRQAARLLWEHMEEEKAEKFAGQRIREQRKDYGDEDRLCQDLFVNAPWWKRTWILQEVIHSGEVVVLLDQGDYIALEELFEASQYWREWCLLHKGEPELPLGMAAGAWEPNYSFAPNILSEQEMYNNWFAHQQQVASTTSNLVDLRAAARAAPVSTGTTYPPNLAALVMDFRDQGATDPRDRLYALLGIAAPGSSGVDLVVDYRLTIRKLYTIMARLLLKKVLTILLWVESPERPITPHGEVPSWAPDYRTKQNSFPRFSLGMQAHFSAAAGFPPPAEQEPRFRQAPDEETLIVRGLYVGLITDTFDSRLTTRAASAENRDGIRLITYDLDPALRHRPWTELPPRDPSAWKRQDPVRDSSWGPIHARIGDWIVIVPGLNMPVVIRPVEETVATPSGPSESADRGERHLFVGGCWLVESKVRVEVFQEQDWTQNSGFSPIMFGSALKDLPADWKPEEFVLV